MRSRGPAEQDAPDHDDRCEPGEMDGEPAPTGYSKIAQLVDEPAPTSLKFPNVFGGRATTLSSVAPGAPPNVWLTAKPPVQLAWKSTPNGFPAAPAAAVKAAAAPTVAASTARRLMHTSSLPQLSISTLADRRLTGKHSSCEYVSRVTDFRARLRGGKAPRGQRRTLVADERTPSRRGACARGRRWRRRR